MGDISEWKYAPCLCDACRLAKGRGVGSKQKTKTTIKSIYAVLGVLCAWETVVQGESPQTGDPGGRTGLQFYVEQTKGYRVSLTETVTLEQSFEVRE